MKRNVKVMALSLQIICNNCILYAYFKEEFPSKNRLRGNLVHTFRLFYLIIELLNEIRSTPIQNQPIFQISGESDNFV